MWRSGNTSNLCMLTCKPEASSMTTPSTMPESDIVGNQLTLNWTTTGFSTTPNVIFVAYFKGKVATS